MSSNRQSHCGWFLILLFYILFSGYSPDRCTRYTSFGYGYRDYFEYHGGNFSPNQVFYLEFHVKTSSDAHILLKTDISAENAFEIVIGGGSNTFSQIRFLEEDTKKTMVTQKTENFLSGIDYRKFWISIDRLGIISVGRGEDDVFINWRFDNPPPIRYFAFGSWTNMKGDWKFNCNQTGGSEVTPTEGNLTPLMRLKKDLFAFYDPYALPVEKNRELEVMVNFQISYANLDERRGELTLYGTGDLKWMDSKIKWKPENYDGIQTIYIPPFQIWTPTIRVLNQWSLERTPLFDLTTAGVMVKYDGSVFWRPPFKSLSSCTVDLEHWPFDSHHCTVVFGFWMEPSNLVLTVMDEYETVMEENIESEWELVKAKSFNTNTDYAEEENYGLLYLELQRKSDAQAIMFTIPYVAVLVMSLTSFWVPSYRSFKLYLSCGSLLISLLILFIVGMSVPAMTENVPRIVKFYSWSSVLTCIPIMFFVLLRNLQLCIRVPDWLSRVINHRITDRAFCLPELPQDLSDYANLNEDDNKQFKGRLNALRLLTAIERLFFFAYLITIILVNILI